MTAIISWQPNDTSSDVIRHLLEGRLIALPTESTYEVVASALKPQGLALLPTTHVPAIVLFDQAELFDWMPLLRGAGVRVFRKLWPSPVVLRANGGYRQGLWPHLPAPARERVAVDGLLAVRWPAHPIWTDLRAAGLPLVSVPVPGGINAAETRKLVGDSVSCVIDAGDAQYGNVPTVARVEGRGCVVERPGVLTQEQLNELTCSRTVFICTGNTCRSPMAEVLLKQLLSARCEVAVNELARHGFVVQSAGLAAMMGAEASRDAVKVAADHGADLSHHQSRMVTMEMLAWADHIFAMTNGHCSTLESIALEGMVHPRMLSLNHQDIVDPIGAELAAYRTCADQILTCLNARLPEILES